jgi:pyrimidine oxygenase
MGLWPGDEYYGRRYEYAGEYLRVLKEMWRHGSVTHHSEFFDLEDCSVLPRPSREIPIVCAGQSPAGLGFTAEHGDHNFVMATRKGLEKIAAGLAEKAASFGRRAGTYALFTVIAADTEAEADGIADRIVAGADRGAITNVITSASMDLNPEGTSAALQAGLSKSLDQGNIAFMGFPVIKGSHESVAAQVEELGEIAGIDGIMLNFPDFVPGIRGFGERVMPRLSHAGVA